jgi:hypothetical protein
MQTLSRFSILYVPLVAAHAACDVPDDGTGDPDAELTELDAVDLEEILVDVSDEELDGRTRPLDPPGADALASVDDPSEGYIGGWQPIIQVKSGMCLDGGGDVAGSVVRQSHCHFSQRQLWKFLFPPSLAYFRVQNQDTGLCLDMVLGTLTQQPCGSWTTQRFVNNSTAPGISQFKNLFDNECWDIPNGSIDPSNVNGSYPCHSGTNQQWVVVVPDNAYACGL